MKKVLPIILLAAMLLASLFAIIPANAADPATPSKKVATVDAGYEDSLPADAVPISSLSGLRSLSNQYGYLTTDLYINLSDVSDGCVNGGWLPGTTTLDGCGYTIYVYKDIDIDNTEKTAFSCSSGESSFTLSSSPMVI